MLVVGWLEELPNALFFSSEQSTASALGVSLFFIPPFCIYFYVVLFRDEKWSTLLVKRGGVDIPPQLRLQY